MYLVPKVNVGGTQVSSDMYSIDYKFKNELPFDARIARIVRALRIEISRKLFLPIINSVRGLFLAKKGRPEIQSLCKLKNKEIFFGGRDYSKF